jgi:uncharacterized protein (DUF305 family)
VGKSQYSRLGIMTVLSFIAMYFLMYAMVNTVDAGAILMCERASIRDFDLKRLCQNIVSSQQAEIDQMKAMLRGLRD